eukprot:CAMPEP_0197434098 /NCGR_PEP_ID=MMETSP1175-20131217/1864_1 /TAXON_ID=1003142 /ORGANISM="Triceratium dubium, Strain CCMP147" /LENGTH=204 /DNA_ID=CAMNT_0042962689 /DNA_START=90 /DNA_END=704 /DNA_ORIENTATION=+
MAILGDKRPLCPPVSSLPPVKPSSGSASQPRATLSPSPSPPPPAATITAHEGDETVERLRDSMVAWRDLRHLSDDMSAFLLKAKIDNAKARAKTEASKRRRRDEKQQRQNLNAVDASDEDDNDEPQHKRARTSPQEDAPLTASGVSLPDENKIRRLAELMCVLRRTHALFERELAEALDETSDIREAAAAEAEREAEERGASNE